MAGVFPLYVLLEGDVQDVESKVAEQMAPYDRAREVAEHEGQCPCVHAEAEAKGVEMFLARGEILVDEEYPWAAHVEEKRKALEASHRATIQELLDKAAPDPNCPECGGSGVIKTMANPQGQWERWEIGGPYLDGLLAGSLTEAVATPNIVPVRLLNLERTLMPVSIITPDGKWHTACEPYWFGLWRIDDPDWDNKAQKILQQHTDAILVVVECRARTLEPAVAIRIAVRNPLDNP